jgi:hypothetical protein
MRVSLKEKYTRQNKSWCANGTEQFRIMDKARALWKLWRVFRFHKILIWNGSSFWIKNCPHVLFYANTLYDKTPPTKFESPRKATSKYQVAVWHLSCLFPTLINPTASNFCNFTKVSTVSRLGMSYFNTAPPLHVLMCNQQDEISDFKQASRLYLVCLIIM